MVVSHTPRINQTRWSSGQDTVKREDFDADAASLEVNAAVFKEGTLAERPAAGVIGRFYTVKNDSTVENNGKQFYDNGAEWRTISYTNNQLAESIGAGDTALTVRSKASPTADAFDVQSSDKKNLLRVTSDGYTTNQATSSGPGARLGAAATHEAAGIFNSVAPAKPAVIVRNAADQTANAFEVRSSGNANLAYIDRTGGATFSGGVVTSSVTSTGAVVAPALSVSQSADLFNTTVTSGASDQVAFSVKSNASTQTVNLIEIYSAQSKRTTRILSNGTIATDGRLLIGGDADSGTQSYANSVAVTRIKNVINPATPILSLEANASSQTGKMLQSVDTAGNIRYWVDSSGAMYAAGNASISTVSVGAGSATPTPYYNGYKPRMEVLTGTGTGAYNESVAIRHNGTSSAAAVRRVGLQLKMSNDDNQTESNKWAGIYARTTASNSSDVNLEFWTAGSVAGLFDADNNMQINGNARLSPNKTLTFGSSSSNKIFLTDNVDDNVIGYQSGGTSFLRSTNFALYSGGTYNSQSLNSGGGTLMASFTPARTIMRRLTLSSASTYNSSEPTLQIGSDSHMQFSPYSINSYDDANNNVPAEVNIANNGGRVRLGNTSSTVSLPSRILWVGNIDNQAAANAILFARSSGGNFNYWVGRAAQNGDWWFDHTSNRMAVHDGTKWQIFMPDHSSAVGITG